MFANCFVRNFSSVPICCQNQTLAPTHHQFRSPNSLLKLKKQTLLPNTQFKISRSQKPRSNFVVFAEQSNLSKGQPQTFFFFNHAISDLCISLSLVNQILAIVFRRGEGVVISCFVSRLLFDSLQLFVSVVCLVLMLAKKFMRVMFTRISFAIQKGLAAQLVARLPSTHV